MKQAFKILLLILAIFPLWLTIMAMGGESKIDALKGRINGELLKVEDRRIQVLEILSRDRAIEEIDLTAKFDVELANVNTTGTSTLVVKTTDSAGRLAQMLRLPVKLFIEEPVAVATRDLNRLDALSTDDYQIVWKDASQLRSPIPHAESLTGQALRLNVKEGNVIYSNQLQHEALVGKGDRVKVRVVGTGILLTVVGQAQESGSKGQTIKVVNTDSRKEFLGVVINTKEVEVRL